MTAVATLHETEQSLRELDPDTLREMVFQTATEHIAVCELTSRIGDCAHLGANDIRDRIDTLTVAQLAAILAPTAWISIELHRRLGT